MNLLFLPCTVNCMIFFSILFNQIIIKWNNYKLTSLNVQLDKGLISFNYAFNSQGFFL
jgi:hypothetical protein